MKHILDTLETENFKLEVTQDENPCNPRDWCNLGLIHVTHKNSHLGDKSFSCEEILSLEKEKTESGEHVVIPLYLYRHGGEAISITPFSCSWDSSRIGFVSVSHETIKAEYGEVNESTIDLAKSCIEAEIEIFDNYIQGDVYNGTLYKKKKYKQYELDNNSNTIEDTETIIETWEEIDSISSFYGDYDIKTNGMTDNIFNQEFLDECLILFPNL